ncbi:lytic transglycosylase domain-containing protein [Polynucleobacter necessarius]|uniref:lytic transglycosylase domain-containing protein n=1 Tax=Polynucleobacter necessarius TaxID=576610 RepID=UPI0018D5793B|nr:lytic transglycosylase domain-containing protein [Polynucleobacter necessarius]
MFSAPLFQKMRRIGLLLLMFMGHGVVFAANQKYEDISLANRYELRQSLASEVGSISSFRSAKEAVDWIGYQSRNLASKIPNETTRRQWLRMVHYEATRYSLDPDLVLALIEVESGFNRFAISKVGASGLMQVMPFWKDLIGDTRDSLFDVRTNLRYGCIILKHYLAMENQNLSRGLARYNGSLGEETYPSMVTAIWRTKYRFSEERN